ncbi:chemotaxis protein CheW [Deinococcus depolymerans]|uniref:CheW-like domain-containing protein n=1 Tax=Deinococcus depolymerans TaxID=392408 RepID=A0ABP3M7V5_9DEIO
MTRLERRAVRLALPLDAQRPPVNALRLQVAGEAYAAPLAQLLEILPANLTALPLTAPHVAGLQVVRGELLGVLRADVLLTGRACEPQGPGRVLLTSVGAATCGLLVDDATDLVWVDDQLRPPLFHTPGVSGLTPGGLAVLDLTRLLHALPSPWRSTP